MKKIIVYLLVITLSVSNITLVSAAPSEYQCDAESVVLMEAGSGKVILEKKRNERLCPASITKIMTLLLIFDSIDSKKIKLGDNVTTSANAKSMGGSQVFLEEGEVQTVETLIKCIVIASGNDASVAMAEHIAGSEEKFVEMMNQRAKSLGMKDTNFVDCCGLTDSDEHYTSAYDVALMTRELTNKYPQILEYSSIWMETIVHNTKKGSKEFVLSNTNKLLKTDSNVKGLKTGSTSKAKYCVSNVAVKDGMKIISVVMAAKDYKQRFFISESLLKYAYSNCFLYKDKDKKDRYVAVANGKEAKVKIKKKEFSYVLSNKGDIKKIKKKVALNTKIKAPVKKGESVGKVYYYFDGKKIGFSNFVTIKAVDKMNYIQCVIRLLKEYIAF